MQKNIKSAHRGGRPNQGLVKMIVLIVIGILILSYFGFNLKSIAESPTSKGNFSYVWGWLSYVWNTFLAAPAIWVLNKIIVGIFWELALKPGLQALETVSRH